MTEDETKSKLSLFIDKWATSWTATFLYIFLFVSFFFQAFSIPSASMNATLLTGDSLFVKKFKYGFVTPYIPFLNIEIIPGTDGHLVDFGGATRGDIVVFRWPKNPNIMYVKRLVGMPGDKLFMEDKVLYISFNEGDKWMRDSFPKEKLVTIGGILWAKNPLASKYPGIHNDSNVTKADLPNEEAIFNFPITEVPEDEYFMIGDNRDHSNDSRFWGTVKYGAFIGSPSIIYFSSTKSKFRLNRIFSMPE